MENTGTQTAEEANQSAQPEESKEQPVIYNANAEQRFPFFIVENGAKYEGAHRFAPFTDERWIQHVNEMNIDIDLLGSTEVSADHAQKVITKLWRDLVIESENIEVEAGDFRDYADYEGEILPSIQTYTAVTIKEPEESPVGRRKVGAQNQIIFTEAYFNGAVCTQKHVLKTKSDEFSKKYSRIQRKEYKTEPAKTAKGKDRLFFIPQDKAKAELYDEMFIDQEGFAGDVPIRFKALVISTVFASKIDPKK